MFFDSTCSIFQMFPKFQNLRKWKIHINIYSFLCKFRRFWCISLRQQLPDFCPLSWKTSVCIETLLSFVSHRSCLLTDCQLVPQVVVSILPATPPAARRLCCDPAWQSLWLVEIIGSWKPDLLKRTGGGQPNDAVLHRGLVNYRGD